MRPWRIVFFLCLLFWSILDAFAIRAVHPENPCTGDFGGTVSRARYFNPELGRFWTMDTFEGTQRHPLSLHKYLYCEANPVNGVDPSGRFFDSISTLFAGFTMDQVESAEAFTAAVAQRLAAKRLAYAMARATIAILGTLVLTGDDATPSTELQTEQRLNPTGSEHAYQKYECIEFADDAMTYFAKRGKDPKKISYRSFPGKTRGHKLGGNICAAPGFGIFGRNGGENIAEDGYHEGTLVDGNVYDNNVPFGVPRRMWENGYEVSPLDQPIGVYLTLRQAHFQKYGELNPAP